MSTLEWALAYAKAGFAILPVWPPTADGSTCSCEKGKECDRPAKHPIPRQGVKQASTDEERIRAWWDEYPDANIAMTTGSASGVIVIDVDTGDGKEGDIAITQACADQGGVPRTLKARSGSGGAHYFYKFRDNPFTRKIGFLKHVDYLSDGGYVIVEPSRNLKGSYAFDPEAGVGGSPTGIGRLRKQMGELPEWFDKLEGSGRKGKKKGTRERSEESLLARLVNNAGMEFNPLDPVWVEHLQGALRAIDPDSREHWQLFGIILGRAFDRSEEGFKVYEEWSSHSAKFSDKGTAKAMWNFYHIESLNLPQGGEPATIATIFRIATEAGWVPPRNGSDRRPTVAYRQGRAVETAATILRLLQQEREAGNDGDLRIYAFGSGLGQIIEHHDHGAMYSEEGKPPNGWPMKMLAYNAMAFGSRATHTCTVLRFTPNGAPTQVECPMEVSTLMLAEYPKYFPRLNGIVQWPMIVHNRIAGFDEPYDAKAGLAFNLPQDLDLTAVKGTKKEATAAWRWIREVALEGFPLEEREAAAALAMLLTFMQRRIMKTAPAFMITAPIQGTGKTALVKLASHAVHGRSVAASSLSSLSEEQRKTITAALLTNQPCLLFDNLKEGSTFNSEELAIAMTSAEWEDRKLGVTERLSLPNRTVWCFTGNNVSLKGDLRRRFVTIRLVSKLKKHYAQKFTRVIEDWAVTNRNAVLTALSSIALWGSQVDHKLLTDSGFSDWDREVRGPVYGLTGIDPFISHSEQAGEEDEDEEGESIAAVVSAWAMACGDEKSTVREFVEKAHASLKSSDSSRRHIAEAFNAAVAFLRGEKEDRLKSEDYGYAIKLLQDRPIDLDGVSLWFKRVGMKHKVALWQLQGGAELAEKLSKEF